LEVVVGTRIILQVEWPSNTHNKEMLLPCLSSSLEEIIETILKFVRDRSEYVAAFETTNLMGTTQSTSSVVARGPLE
jgi:hypothetical protein